MPRRCTICTRKQRAEIDQALVARQSFRAISRQFSVSKDALLRHHDDYLPAALMRAQEAAEAAQVPPGLEPAHWQAAINRDVARNADPYRTTARPDKAGHRRRSPGSSCSSTDAKPGNFTCDQYGGRPLTS